MNTEATHIHICPSTDAGKHSVSENGNPLRGKPDCHCGFINLDTNPETGERYSTPLVIHIPFNRLRPAESIEWVYATKVTSNRHLVCDFLSLARVSAEIRVCKETFTELVMMSEAYSNMRTGADK